MRQAIFSRHRCLWGLVLLMGLVSGARSWAQTEWSAVPSGTTRNLWGVWFGGGQFVAVGEGGVILTSPDGQTWTPRVSGTSAWLTSVTYALDHFIAVGAGGTVLLSRDGVAWQPASARGTAPTARLNVVRFDGSSFLAYGEHRSVCRFDLPPLIDASNRVTGPWLRCFVRAFDRLIVGGEAGLTLHAPADMYLTSGYTTPLPTAARNVSGLVLHQDSVVAVAAEGRILVSSDGLVWTEQPSGTTADLQDITPYNNTLIVAGDNGTILTRDGAGAWTRRTTPTTARLLGVAGGPGAAVAVGLNGNILRSPAAVSAPAILQGPVRVTESLGGAASFVVQASGSLPLTYQWSRNFVPLPGETHAELILAPLKDADAGGYTVTVSNAAGTITSSAATLSLLPAAPAVVDPGFQADAALEGEPTSLLPLADGGVLVALGQVNQLVKLRADGTKDPDWSVSTFGSIPTRSGSVAFNQLALQSDGRILVGGDFSSHNGQPSPTLIRLLPNGARDQSFLPSSEIAARFVSGVSVQPDGRILVANYDAIPYRLLPDGRLDPTFQPQPLEPARTFFGEPRPWSVRSAQATADGGVMVAAVADLRVTLVAPAPRLVVVRLHATGALDTSFAAYTWNGFLIAVRALDDQDVLVVSNSNQGLLMTGALVQRLQRNGLPSPAHLAPRLPWVNTAYVYASGAAILLGHDASGPVRLDPLGAVDPTFTGGIGRPAVIAAAPDGKVYVAGPFSNYHGTPSQRLARLNVVPDGTQNAPVLLGLRADKTTVSYGESITVRAAVVGSGALSFEWDGAPAPSPTLVTTGSPVLSFAFTTPRQSNTLRLTVRNTRGEVAGAPLIFTVLPDPPLVTRQPTRVSAQSGRDLDLKVDRNETANRVEIEWRHNGRLLPRPDDLVGDEVVLRLPGIAALQAGTYTVTLRNALGAEITSAPMLVTVDDSARFTNLSTRARIGPGEQTLIAGFAITGERPRQVLVRAVGPTLSKFSVADALPDPRLTLERVAGPLGFNVVFSQDGWEALDGNGTASAAVGAFALDPGSKDNLGVPTLKPGAYTVQLTSASGQTGSALLEIYEYDNNAARMLNVSSRARVSPDAAVISGLSIQGPVPKRVLVRAAGPALAAFGVTGPLSNPRLTLRDAGGSTVAANDDWGSAGNPDAVREAMTQLGAFPFATGSRDAALLITLPPGGYTAVVEGAPGEAGVALIEVYELPVP